MHKGWSVRRAAEEYGVPRATLGDRVSGRVKPGAVSGPSKYLSTDEEEEDNPMQIFNIDETGMPLDAKCQRGIFKVGERNPVAITSGDETQIAIVGCVNAAGLCLPPMVIWDRKHFH